MWVQVAKPGGAVSLLPSSQAPSRIPRLTTPSSRRQGLTATPQSPDNTNAQPFPGSNKSPPISNKSFPASNKSPPISNKSPPISNKSSPTNNNGRLNNAGTSGIPLPSKVPLQLAQPEAAMPSKPPSRFKRLKSFIKHGNNKGLPPSENNLEAKNTRIGSAETVSTLIAMSGPSVSITPSPTHHSLITSPSQPMPSPTTSSPTMMSSSPPILHTPDCPYKTNPILSFRHSNISFPKSPSKDDMETKEFEQATVKSSNASPLPEFCQLKTDQRISGSHFDNAVDDQMNDFPFISSKPCSSSTPIHKLYSPDSNNTPSFKINPKISSNKKPEENNTLPREATPYPKLVLSSRPYLSQNSSPSIYKKQQEIYYTANAHFLSKADDPFYKESTYDSRNICEKDNDKINGRRKSIKEILVGTNTNNEDEKVNNNHSSLPEVTDSSTSANNIHPPESCTVNPIPNDPFAILAARHGKVKKDNARNIDKSIVSIVKTKQNIDKDAFEFQNMYDKVAEITYKSALNSILCKSDPDTQSSNGDRASQNSSMKIADRDLWASSDSFICESFPQTTQKTVQMSQQENVPDIEFDLTKEIYSSINGISFPKEISFEDYDSLDCEVAKFLDKNSELNPWSSDWPGTELNKPDNWSVNNVFEISPSSLSPSGSDVKPMINDEILKNVENDTLLESEVREKDNWIRFDSSENIVSKVNEVENRIDCDSATDPPEPLTPDSVGSDNLGLYVNQEHSHSCHNLVGPPPEPTKPSNSGLLIRQYSRRGRQVQRNLSERFNRHLNTPCEYGKFRNPRPPMFSKAALSMQTGSGFLEDEKSNNSSSPERISSSKSETIEEISALSQVVTADLIGDNNKKDTSTTHTPKHEIANQPQGISRYIKGGESFRYSKRNSTAENDKVIQKVLNKETNNVPANNGSSETHKSPLVRRGSFRKALDSINSLAHKLKHGSSISRDSQNVSPKKDNDPPENLRKYTVRKSDSFKSDSSKSTPKAPQLPRRAKSFKNVFKGRSNKGNAIL